MCVFRFSTSVDTLLCAILLNVIRKIRPAQAVFTAVKSSILCNIKHIHTNPHAFCGKPKWVFAQQKCCAYHVDEKGITEHLSTGVHKLLVKIIFITDYQRIFHS